VSIEGHLYTIEIIDNIIYGDLAIFTCVNHPKDEFGFGGCSNFQAFLNPEPKIREQIAREIGELPEYTETEAYKRAAFYLDRDDVMNAIARKVEK